MRKRPNTAIGSRRKPPKVLEAVGRHFGVPHRSPAPGGAYLAEAFNQIGIYAGKIIKGVVPSTLPVVQPTR
jgi:hypothetical protein